MSLLGSACRLRLVPIVALISLAAACKSGSGDSNPVGPDNPATTSPTNTSAHYVGAPNAGQPPVDILLFFSLSAGASSSAALGGFSITPRAATTTYNVSGSFNTGAGGVTGSVTGTLSGTPQSGTFQGVLTADVNGCPASKNYSGPLTDTSLSWTPGSDVAVCPGASPLPTAISTQVVSPSPVTATSATYSGPFSATMLLNETSSFTGGVTGCIRSDTDSGTLTLVLTIASDGTVTGTGHAIGSEVVTAFTPTDSRFSCGNFAPNTVGNTGPYETRPGEHVTGTTRNFGFTDSQTSPNGAGSVVFDAVFSGTFSGNVITGLFTNSENLMPGGFGTGTGAVTLTRQ